MSTAPLYFTRAYLVGVKHGVIFARIFLLENELTNRHLIKQLRMKKLYLLKAALALCSLLLVFGTSSVQAQDTLQIGNGTVTNGTTGYPAPYGNWYWGARHQFLIPACDLNAQGVAIDSITSLAFDVASAQGTPLTDFTIMMGHSNLTDMTVWETGLQTVFFDSLYTDVAGWNVHAFDTTFVYDGVSNIVVEVCFNNSGFTNNAVVNQSTTSHISTRYFRQDGAGVCGNTGLTATATQMPNMRLGVWGAATSADIGVVAVTEPLSGCALGTEAVTACIVNFSQVAQGGFPLSYNIDDTTGLVTETFIGVLLPGDTAYHTFAAGADLSAGGTFNITAWTSLAGDGIACNDSASLSVTNVIPVNTFPYIETFESDTPAVTPTLGLLSQSGDDDTDWTLNQGNTPSSNFNYITGPLLDHTWDTLAAGTYAYLETSGGVATGDEAWLTSPCIDIAAVGSTPYIHFWYHMFGAEMGTLNLQISDDEGATWNTVWTRTGDQGLDWLLGKVDLTVEGYATSVIQYRFVAIDGTSFTGDVAIDDIMVFDKPYTVDMILESIDNPTATTLCPTLDLDTLSVTIGNCGTQTESNYNLNYTINGGATVTEPVFVAVAPTATATYNFASLIDFSDTGSYDFQVWVTLAGDSTPQNDTATYSVTVISPPVAFAGVDTAVCPGEAADFNAGAGFASYEWSNGSFSQQISPTTAGTYSVIVTNAGGCSDTADVSLVVFGAPVVSLGNDTSYCPGDTLLLDAGTWSEYLWSNGDTTSTLIIDTNYAQPCSWTIDMEDSFGDGWNGNTLNVYLDTNIIEAATLLGGTNGTATFQVSPGDSLSFEWIVGGFPTEPEFVIYDASGDTVWFDGQGGGAPTPGFFLDTIGYCPVPNPLTVTVDIVDANGCPASDAVEILRVDTLSLDLGPDFGMCIGETATFDAGLIGATYAWSTGETTQSITVDTAGTYILTLTKCGTVVDTVVITELALPTVDLPTDTIMCAGDSVMLDAGAGTLSYDWSNNTTGQTTQLFSSCDYNLDMFDSFGDGWNGAAMDVYADNALVGSYTFTTGNSANAQIPLVDGCALRVEFASGGFANEESYVLSDPFGNVIIADGPFPVNGEVFNGFASCFGGGASVTVTDTITGCTAADTMGVVVNKPHLDLGPDTTLCVGEMYTIDAGPQWASYLWWNNSTNQTLDVFGSGVFYVDVVDSNGCATVDSIVVIFNPLPTPDLGPDQDVCEGSVASLNAGVYTDYVWNNGDSTQFSAVDTAGTWWVDVFDAAGCTGSDTIMTIYRPAPTTNFPGDTAICNGDSLILDAGPYDSWSWNTGDTLQTITVDSNGLYSVFVTDTFGCSAIDAITLTIIDSVLLDLGPDGGFCDGDSMLLDAGLAGASYVWNTGDSTQTIWVNTFGSYVLDMSACGNSASDTINLVVYPKPIINAGGDLILCPGDTAMSVATGAFTYDWFVGDSVLVSSSDTVIGVPSENTLLVVYGTDTNGCMGTDSLNISILPTYAPDLGADTVLCDGDALTLDAGNDGSVASYLWDDASTGQTRTVTTGGTYTVCATDTAGCTVCDSIVIITLVLPTVDLGPDTSVCDNEVYTINSGGGMSSYLWSDSSTAATIDVSTGGTYYVDVVDFFGCAGSDTVQVTGLAAPVVDLGADTTICVGDTVVLDAGAGAASYLWHDSTMTQTYIADTTSNYSVDVVAANGCSASDDVAIALITTTPVVDLGADQVACAGDSVQFSVGFPGATYSWNTGSTANNVWVSTTSTVIVDVTVCGLTGSDTADVVINNLPALDLGPDTFYCEGGAVFSLTLDAGPALIYNWSDGSSAQTLVVDTAGTYYVDITNFATGCSNSDTVVVDGFVAPALVDLGPDVSLCPGDTAFFDAGAGFTYLWQDGSTGQTFSTTTSDTVYVTSSSVMCGFATDTVIVVADSGATVDLGADVVVCSATDYTITVPGSFATYLWNDSSTGSTLLVDTAGTYSVDVTNTAGCPASDDVMVTFAVGPVVDLGADAALCPGDSVTFDAGAGVGYTYLWQDGSTGQTYTSTVTEEVSVTISTTLCGSASDTAQVVVDAGATVDLGPDQVVCGQNDYVITAPSGFASYAWTGGSTADSLLVDTSGTYQVVVTNAAGCTGTDEIEITFSTTLLPDLGPDVEFCEGGSETLDAGAGFATYDWDGGETTQTIDVTVSGTYTVSVSNAAGCTGSDEVVVTVNANPVPDLGADLEITEFTDTDLDAGAGFASYLWSTTETTQIITVTGNSDEEYCVTVTDANGCEGSDCVQVDTLWNSISELAAQRINISYFPNPSLGAVKLTVKSAESIAFTMSIVGIDGKLIHSEQLNVGSGTFVKDLSMLDLAQGVYYVKLDSDKGSQTDMLVIH